MTTHARGDRGAVAVEFALVFPLLAALLLGMVDLGFALNAKIAMTSAAREGVRAVALGGDAAAAESRVADALSTNGQVLGTAVAVTPCATGDPGSTATVVLTGSVGTVLPVDDIALTARAVMQCGG